MKPCYVVLGIVLLGLFAVSHGGLPEMRKPNIKPETIIKRLGVCPPPKTLKGDCTFDEKKNCLTDDKCSEGQKCCREGCNKICKPVMSALPKDMPWPDFGVLNRWKAEKTKEWNAWADETRKMMMDQIAGLWEIATPANENNNNNNNKDS